MMMNEWMILTSTSGIFVGKVLISLLKTKSPNSKTTQGYQTMKRSIRVSTGSINTIQIKLVQTWTINGCKNTK